MSVETAGIERGAFVCVILGDHQVKAGLARLALQWKPVLEHSVHQIIEDVFVAVEAHNVEGRALAVVRRIDIHILLVQILHNLHPHQ